MTGYYDWVIKKVMPDGFREILVEKINLSPGEMLLDFGTGTAEIAILLKKATPFSIIAAIDIDPRILNIAKKKIIKENLDILITRYSGEVFPFSNNYFDKVLSCLVFHHLSPEHKRKALFEIFRVLKNGGKIYIADWGLERNKTKASLLNFFKYFNVLKHIVEQGKGMLPQYLKNAGFKNEIETSYLKTISGTLCYYEAEK